MGFKVAVVGATGAVGKEMLEVLRSRRFPVSELVLFASPRSEGKEIRFNDKSYRCQVLKPGCFAKSQIAFFDASDEISKEWSHQAADEGAWVVDNSATYRMDETVPLLVPEVNGDLLKAKLQSAKLSAKERILAGPNCTTVQLVVALKPLRDHWGLKRVVVSTYQSVSGAGAAAMEELRKQTGEVLSNRVPRASVLAHPIAFNSIPQIGGFRDDGYTSEEFKVIAESRKILGLPNLRITATAVRIPTLSCHGESVNVECERPFKIEDVRKAFEDQDGLLLHDDPSKKQYPMAIDATGRDDVYVGRLRADASVENGLNFWIVSDNLRKGAALNAIQIGEMIAKHAFV
jgi:aspartate-semialdehyde dehydrogenase